MKPLLCVLVLAGCNLYYGDDAPPGETPADGGHPQPPPPPHDGGSPAPIDAAPPVDAAPLVDAAAPLVDAAPPPDAPVGIAGAACSSDTECNTGLVCDAYSKCADEATVRDVTVTWEYMGYPASTYTCTTVNVSSIRFRIGSATGPATVAFACSNGTATIPHVPITTQYIYTENPNHRYEQCYYIARKVWIDPNALVHFDISNIDGYDYCGL